MKRYLTPLLSTLLATCAIAAPLRTTYDYPEQSGRDSLLKADPGLRLLNDGRPGHDGPSAVWGQWNAKRFIVDWDFRTPSLIRWIEVTINRTQEDNENIHPQRLNIYAALTPDGSFSQRPVYTAQIPFETTRRQVVRIPMPGNGIAAARLRTEFETDKYQIVLSEVVFDGGPASAADIAATAAAIENAAGNTSGSSSTGSSSAANQRGAANAQRDSNAAQSSTKRGQATTAVRYDFPRQPGFEHMAKTDPNRSQLTDGITGTTGSQALWGQWNQRDMMIDWSFGKPVRIKAINIVIVHPSADSENSHPASVSLYGRSGGATEYLAQADFSRDIPFEAGSLQEVRFVLPGDGIVAEDLRSVFTAARFQVVLTEVSFETEPASAQEAKDAQSKRENNQPEVFETINWFPRKLDPSVVVQADSIFGVCGHFLHTNQFFSHNNKRFNNHWRPQNTMPWLVEGNFNWVRETLYMGLFKNDSGGLRNRQLVEDYLQEYQDRGVRVLLGPMYGGAKEDEELRDFAAWIGSLSKRFDAVQAVELHNEPNLKGFWKGTPQEFVDVSREFTRAVKAEDPQAVIVAGSFSGWGGAWNHPDLRELVAGERDLATKYAEEVFSLGLLEFADAVSAHPYRGASAPEGGDVIEARTDPEGFEKEIRNYLDLAAKYTPGNKRLPLHLTEIGYSVSTQGYSNVPDEARQADYITRLMLLLLGMRLDGVPIETVFWYDLKQDEMDDSHYESNFGIVSPSANRPRPAWTAVRRINEFFAFNDDFEALPDAALQLSNGDDLTKSYLWRRKSDGSLIVPFWRMNQLQRKDTDFDSNLTLTLPEGFDAKNATVLLHDLHEDRPREVAFKKLDYTNALLIPLHVTSRAAWLELRDGSATAAR